MIWSVAMDWKELLNMIDRKVWEIKTNQSEQDILNLIKLTTILSSEIYTRVGCLVIKQNFSIQAVVRASMDLSHSIVVTLAEFAQFTVEIHHQIEV